MGLNMLTNNKKLRYTQKCLVSGLFFWETLFLNAANEIGKTLVLRFPLCCCCALK